MKQQRTGEDWDSAFSRVDEMASVLGVQGGRSVRMESFLVEVRTELEALEKRRLRGETKAGRTT